VSLPGWALARASMSFTELMPDCGLVASSSVPQAASDTGVKSVTGLNGTFLYRLAAISRVLALTITVCPSGAALATWSAPMLPLAPGLFSTITGWPRRSESFGPTVRAMMSMPVPGVKGTTTLIGWLGQVWAWTVRAGATSALANAAASADLRVSLMVLS